MLRRYVLFQKPLFDSLEDEHDMNTEVRLQGIMLQILLIMLFQIFPKNLSLCLLLFIYAPHCYHYSIKLYQ